MNMSGFKFLNVRMDPVYVAWHSCVKRWSCCVTLYFLFIKNTTDIRNYA